MYLKSEVVRGQSDGLRQERWMFNMSDSGKVYVSFYTLSERTTRRQGYKMVSHYDRIAADRSDIKVPPLPGGVLEEGLRLIRDQIVYDGSFPVQGL